MKNLIYPELFKKGKWSVNFTKNKSLGMTHLGDQKMVIPSGNTPLERFVRFHELAHAKWSPPFPTVEKSGLVDLKDKLSKQLLLSSEDGRINYRMINKSKISVDRGMQQFYDSTFDNPAISATDESYLNHLLFVTLVSQASIPEYASGCVQELRQRSPERAAVARRALKLYRKHSGDWTKSTAPIIRMLKQFYTSQMDQEGGGEGDTQGLDKEKLKSLIEALSKLIEAIIICSEENEQRIQAEIEKQQEISAKEKAAEKSNLQNKNEKSRSDKSSERLNQELEQHFTDIGLGSEFVRNQIREDDYHRKFMEDFYRNKSDSIPIWGDMTVETPSRSILISKKPMVKHIMSDSGIIPRQIYRLPIDGMIFCEPHKNYRDGSVLIDCSGSMHISVEEIEEIVRACPGMIVAGYSGIDNHGVLRIFAKDGKMCKSFDLDIKLGGNTVDFPALEWLAKQKHPRFWISDGNVFGAENRHGREYVNQCFDFTKKNKILRILNLEQMKRFCTSYRI